ncbi:MAG TPA: ABC transporter ATP-binding protein [Caulobacteraceae bacterium]|nr:ABC transporter ATP-binding protein [Caulobacteraceae bacterium]
MFRLFERLIEPYPEDASVPPPGLRAFYWSFLRPVWRLILAVSAMSALISVAEVAVFGFMGKLVDWLGKSTPETFLALHGTELVVMGAVLLVGLPLLQTVWQLSFHQGVMGNFPMHARWRMHRHLLRQSIGFFQDDMAGRLANTIMQTALSIRESVLKVADILVYVGVYFISTSVLVASADWRLTIPFLVWLGAYLCVCVYFVPRLQKIAEAQADARSVMTGRVVDSYTNILTVKLFAHTRSEDEYARESMGVFLDAVYRQMRRVTQLNIILSLLNYLLLVAIVIVSIGLWRERSLTVGGIAVAVTLAQRLQGMSQWILWELGNLFENIGTVQDGMQTVSRPRAVQDAPGAPPLAVRKGAIAYENVTFHYGKGGGVLPGFDLAIAACERVGLVGPSGAGKSTLTSLLLRLYDVEGGRIVIDGQDIAKVDQESLRASIGVVTQETALLHRSVRANIAYGRPGASEADIEAAARRAHAHEFILGLKDGRGRTGYDAHVGERGVNLSGGQRQRIAIARVLLKDAPILVLDEATSALDSEIEAAIQESLAELMRGKTVIAIAHRLSTIARMDRLVVLDAGRIVETGSHAQLVNAGGLYARLWARQTGGFLPDVVDGATLEAAAQ